MGQVYKKPEIQDGLPKIFQEQYKFNNRVTDKIDRITSSLENLESATSNAINYMSDLKKYFQPLAEQVAEKSEDIGKAAGQIAAKDATNLIEQGIQQCINDDIQPFLQDLRSFTDKFQQINDMHEKERKDYDKFLTRVTYVALFFGCLTGSLVGGFYYFFT